MKKIIVCIISLILITGCGCSKKENLSVIDDKYKEQNNKIEEKINNITIGDNKIFEGLTMLDDNMLGTSLGLTKNDVQNYVIALPTTGDARLYIIIKPKKGKEERVKKQLESYIDYLNQMYEGDEEKINLLKNKVYQEYNGYHIYVSSDDNEIALKTIKENLKK